MKISFEEREVYLDRNDFKWKIRPTIIERIGSVVMGILYFMLFLYALSTAGHVNRAIYAFFREQIGFWSPICVVVMIASYAAIAYFAYRSWLFTKNEIVAVKYDHSDFTDAIEKAEQKDSRPLN